MFTPHNRSYVPWFQFLWPSTVFHFGLGFQHFLEPPQTPPQLLLLLLWRLVPRWRLGVVRNFWRAYVFVCGVVRLFRFLNSVVQAFREVTLICWKVEQLLKCASSHYCLTYPASNVVHYLHSEAATVEPAGYVNAIGSNIEYLSGISCERATSRSTSSQQLTASIRLPTKPVATSTSSRTNQANTLASPAYSATFWSRAQLQTSSNTNHFFFTASEAKTPATTSTYITIDTWPSTKFSTGIKICITTTTATATPTTTTKQKPSANDVTQHFYHPFAFKHTADTSEHQNNYNCRQAWRAFSQAIWDWQEEFSWSRFNFGKK